MFSSEKYRFLLFFFGNIDNYRYICTLTNTFFRKEWHREIRITASHKYVNCLIF